MALKQSAFNFDFEPEEKKPEEEAVEIKGVAAVDEVKNIDTVDEQIREVEFAVEEKKASAIVKKEKKSTRGRMKLSEMNAVVDLIEVPEDEILFQKRYYSIGNVSEMFKVNVSLIRFWENEFDILKPKKNGKGDRHFRPEDVKNLKLIYHLLRERKYTIEGAKEFIKKNRKIEEKFAIIEGLQKLKTFLNELKANF
jgi:DNA-binding transcriptional MerR regulator